MKYLFFDIECSNCFGDNPKICEFGYTIVDENFKLITKNDIPMSPGKNNHANRFDLGVYKRDPKFEWAYDFDYYFSQPEFPEYYEKIKRLITDKDTIVLGYSLSNDIHYLNRTMIKCDLDILNYDSFDVQKMIRRYLILKNDMSLEKAFNKLCNKSELIKLHMHLSCDDAFMTMRVFESLCKKLHKTPQEMINLYEGVKYNSIESLENFNKRQEEKEKRKISEELLNDFYNESKGLIELNDYSNNLVYIDSNFKKYPEELKDLIKEIKSKGFIGSRDLKDINYFIFKDEDNIERIREILKENNNFRCEIIDYKEIMNLDK